MAFAVSGVNFATGSRPDVSRWQTKPVVVMSAVGRNPIGVHAFVFTGGWDEDCARKAALGASSAGYDVLEVPMMDRQIDAEMTRRVLKEFNLTPTCTLGLTFDTDISCDDADVVRKGELVLNDALDNAASIGSKYLGGVIYGALGKYSSPAKRRGVDNCIQVLRRLARRAETMGIDLGLEPCNRYETNVINTLDEARLLIDRIDVPNVYIHADAYHMQIEEENVVEAIHKHSDRIGYFHIGASHRGYLGSGSIDLPAIFQALSAINYPGVITFESFSSKVVDPSLTQALAIWRELWTDSDDIARHAKAYIDREILAASQ